MSRPDASTPPRERATTQPITLEQITDYH